ncbi:hypothetical protein [Christiangramia sabulilitoris]|uniref:Uncharacterized protein n=1 Tax=Christiangramia sabulilitoris TaxID=2583991 RepID=A0A550I7K9_9FLAO|nr:hypothetical protein [Christiangramia sabulilitoris]TRO66941.1 hypothetical protein FGM01_03360 [Christiangramia sabulilitoris]
MTKETDNLQAYLSNPQPFSLLDLNVEGKDISSLYRELHFRAEEEFKEHCYRSMKNYTFQKFRLSVFYRRYQFLLRHLNDLCYWAYRRETEFPAELKKAMNYKPVFNNPWGVKEYSGKINFKPKIKTQQHLNKEIRNYLSKFFKLPLQCIREDSNLYTLSLVSGFFETVAGQNSDIRIEDLNSRSLSMAVNDLPLVREGKKYKIFIDDLLKDRNGQQELYLTSEVEPDGFLDHVINLSLCLMEIPPEIEKYLTNPDGLDEAQTVGDLLAVFQITQSR